MSSLDAHALLDHNDDMLPAATHADDCDHNTTADPAAATVLPSSSSAAASGTSWPAAVFLIVNAALGAGLLNFPQAYDRAGGVVVSLAVQMALLVPIAASLLVLAACAERGDAPDCSATYQATVSRLLGVWGRLSCSTAVAVYCFGTCVTFLIIIRDQAEVLAAWLAGPSFCRSWFLTGAFTMPVTSTLAILPLCFSRRIDFLKYASMVGVAAIFYLDGLIVAQYVGGEFRPGRIKHAPDTWTDVFLVMPTICFGYQCHVSAVPIYSCLRQRSVGVFRRCALLALLICVLTYSVAGAIGYWTFGERVAADVLVSYGVGRPSVLIGVLALSVKTATTYPLLLFCGREALDSLWLEAAGSGVWRVPAEPRRRVVLAAGWFVASVWLGAVAANIGPVIQLLGCLAAVFIFIFPGLCLLSWQLGEADSADLSAESSADGVAEQRSCRRRRALMLLALILVAVGVFVFAVVLTQVMQDATATSRASSATVNDRQCGKVGSAGGAMVWAG